MEELVDVSNLDIEQRSLKLQARERLPADSA